MYECTKCNYETPDIDNFENHVYLHYYKPNMLKCPFCEFYVHSKLDLHLNSQCLRDQKRIFSPSRWIYTPAYLREYATRKVKFVFSNAHNWKNENEGSFLNIEYINGSVDLSDYSINTSDCLLNNIKDEEFYKAATTPLKSSNKMFVVNNLRTVIQNSRTDNKLKDIKQHEISILQPTYKVYFQQLLKNTNSRIKNGARRVITLDSRTVVSKTDFEIYNGKDVQLVIEVGLFFSFDTPLPPNFGQTQKSQKITC